MSQLVNWDALMSLRHWCDQNVLMETHSRLTQPLPSPTSIICLYRGCCWGRIGCLAEGCWNSQTVIVSAGWVSLETAEELWDQGMQDISGCLPMCWEVHSLLLLKGKRRDYVKKPKKIFVYNYITILFWRKYNHRVTLHKYLILWKTIIELFIVKLASGSSCLRVNYKHLNTFNRSLPNLNQTDLKRAGGWRTWRSEVRNLRSVRQPSAPTSSSKTDFIF